MASQRSKKVLAAAVIAAAFVMSGMAAWNFFRPETVVLKDGTKIEGPSVAELGAFADPKLEPHRKSYLENLAAYRKMELIPLAADPEAVERMLLRPVLDGLEADPRNARALALLDAPSKRSLVRTISAVLARSAGLKFDAYVALWPEDAWAVPAHLASSLPTSRPTTQETLSVFRARYERTIGDASSPQRLTAFAVAGDGIVIGADVATPKAVESVDPILDRLRPEGRKLLRGMLAVSWDNFHGTEYPLSQLSARGERVVVVQVITVVEDASGDRYPVWFKLFQEPKSSRWHIYYVSPTVSLRMANHERVAF